MRSRSNVVREQVIKVFWITVAWTLISLSEFSTGFMTLSQLNCDLGDLDASVFLRGSIITGILAGILGGGSLVFFWDKYLRTMNYGMALLRMFVFYCLVYVTVDISTSQFVHSANLNLDLFHPEVWNATFAGFFTIAQLRSFLFWLSIVLLSLVVLQVNDKYGPGVFLSFLMGRYFQPRREERIFMFLDLRGSTTIAEKLGEERYFNFIKDVFQDVTPAILSSRGEIYQYVGDEIVISWPVEKGVKNTNCLNCFLDVQLSLGLKADEYKAKYDNLVPEFKAGLHYGHVMAGEVGVVKREIAFSGDVLNTTARIQSKCNDFGVDILLSKYLLDRLSLDSPLFNPVKIGEMFLRGKEKQVRLYTI